jgi:type IV pilus assembly protein PilA
MFKKALRNEKGLTLIELLAVIVILAIVALIAIPSIMGLIQNSKEDAVKSDAIQIINGAKMLYAQDTTSETAAKSYTWKQLDTVVDVESKTNWESATVTFVKDVPELTTDEAITAGSEKITFNGATVTEINEHTESGTTAIGNGSSQTNPPKNP